MALKQPTSLSDRASYVLGTVIGEMALLVSKETNLKTGSVTSERNVDFELNIKKCAEFYDDTIPQNLHNIVTYHTLKYIADNKLQTTEYNYKVFHLVLRSHVTKFDFSDWPDEIHNMLYMNLPKLKYLKLLYLNLYKMKNENLSYVLEGIEGMKQLETFKCNHCRDDVVKVLCDNCPLINLDICCFHDSVTDMSISSILKLQNLKMLDILGIRFSKERQNQLLLGLPDLKALYYCEQPSRSVTHENKVTSLYYEKDMTDISKFCPLIRELKIRISNNLDLSNLVHLKYLTSLYVMGCFFNSNVLTILETSGYQLTELDIYSHNVSMKTLCIIDVSCPNLIKLSLGCLNNNDEEAELPTNTVKSFQNLEYFSNTVLSRDNYTRCLIFFLCNCVKIKEVEFASAHTFCDKNIDEILTSNPLANLQKLILTWHKLTVQSVYKLLTSCKQLKRLGYTEYCDTITKLKVEELRNYIQKNNLNVDLVKDIFYNKCPSVML